MLQIILTLAIFLILVIPMGKYMYHIATEQKTSADRKSGGTGERR